MILKNYLLIAFRGLRKHKGYTLINVLGLATGLACALLIFLYTWDEWRVDRYHPYAERTYRLISEERSEGQTAFHEGLSGAMAQALQDDFPEVERAVRVINPPYIDTWVYHEANGFKKQFCVADPTLLEVFDLPLLLGDPTTALETPNAVVITESTARQFFGETDPLGQVLEVEGFWGGDYVVTGVLRDIPAHSTLRFDILSGTVAPLFDTWEASDWRPVNIYALLAKGTSASSLERKMPGWMNRYMDGETASRITPHLQPLTRIHLHSSADYGLGGYGNINTVRLLALIGGFILLIAAINFMNLATARATQRAKEVGLRKAVGASRGQLIIQFLGEAVLLSSGALIVALGLAKAALPLLNGFTGKALTLTGGHTMEVLFGFAAFSALVGLLAGTYPAFVLSSFRPAAVLKQALTGMAQGARIRKGLVVFQFALTVVLLIGSGVVYQQWDHLTREQWGFNKDEVVVLPIIAADPTPMWTDNWLGFRQLALKQAFLQHPTVVAASVSHVTPPLSIMTQVRAEGEAEPRQMHYIYADKDFLDTYEIDLIAGRIFEPDLLTSPVLPNILLNETAVRQLGWEDPLGKQVEWLSTGTTFTVVGVIKDFLHQDLSQPIQPFFLTQMGQPPQVLSLRVRLDNFPETLAFLEETWGQFLPTRPFQYAFADENLKQLYQDDVRLGKVAGSFAGLAILIACLGLFGLAAYTAERRLKEIGIRKALGASVANITQLLSGSFLKLVLLANVIAWPLAYYAMSEWLATFAYRVELGVDVFVLTGLLTVCIALCTVGYQAVKAALANPADVLRNE